MGKKSDVRVKGKGKGSQLLIRVDKAEREAFVALCETLDTSAAREIRRFMRDFVARNTPAATEPTMERAPDEPMNVNTVEQPAPTATAAPEAQADQPKPRRAAKAKAE